MDVSHNFRFRWNDHVPHLSKIFTELRFDEVYCDTTIISDDGFVLKAHGAVLSATSRYFEHVLSDVTADQHPIIVLKGANFTELSCLLDYIYEGVTQVDQHLMESVLEVADMLEIKGLSKMKNNLSIKKLIAPSPSSSVISRSSRQSSSPSKSPMPPSHTSQTHSPSCPSSPNESYGPSSAMLKMDNDDSNEVVEPSQKKRHLFHDDKTPLNAGIAETKDYSSTVVTSNVPSHIPVCQTSDYSDQTLGIDLSLSRPTNEEIERTSTKSCSLQEDTPLRKRKIMKYEEYSPPSTDIEWGKIGEKMKDSVLHKKSHFLTRSVTCVKSSPSCTQEEMHKTPSHFTLDKLATILTKDRGEAKSHSENSTSCPTAPLGPKHKLKSSLCSSTLPNHSESEDSSMEVSLDSQVEVLCSDGALTISVTTESACQASLKNLNNFNGAHVSLSLKKAKKRYRYKRQMEAMKKENADERRVLSRTLLKRPNTRFFKRLKSHRTQNQSSHHSESLSVHCDPPFPTEQTKQQTLVTKEKSSSLQVDKAENEASKDNGVTSDVFPAQSRGLNKESEEKSSRAFSCISPLTLFTLPPIKQRVKQTRTTLTLEEKIKVIEAFLDGKSQRQLAHLHGIGKTQVNGIVKKRDEILTLYRENLVRGEKLTMKRQRKSEYAALNDHLIKWYRHMTVVAGVKITTGMLRAKALQLAPQLGYQDFKASNGWLGTFKANHNLKFSRAKKPSESYSNENYEGGESQKDSEFFEDEVEEGTDMTAPTAPQASSASSGGSAAPSGDAVNVHSVGLHLGSMRSDPDIEVTPSGQPVPVGNLTLGNSILSGSAPLPKPPQMSNMTLGTNIAYNLTREHPRSDLTHLSDLHSAPTVNAPPSLAHPPHPTLAKPPDGPLSYKTEDSLAYGYDTQGRMNEGTARGTEYNYTHYGFPSTYYGYHFLGQY